MACSKELRVPKKWSKYHHDSVNEPVDPKLFSEDELLAWMENLGFSTDRSIFSKYMTSIRPYHLMRYQVATLVKNPLNKKLFKLCVNLSLVVFISDDDLETFSRTEKGQLCDAFQLLDEEICRKFPRFPTISEMKQYLSQNKVTEKFIPHILYLADFANDVAKSLIELGNFPQEDVKDYWRRLVVSIAFYLEGVEMEYSGTSDVIYTNYIWKRVQSIACISWYTFQEAMSGAIGSITGHVALLNEIMLLGTLACVVMQDIYSYSQEIDREFGICNVVKAIHDNKNLPGVSEAMSKCVQIFDATLKEMDQKIENARNENPANQKLCELLDNVAKAVIGWYFYHEYSPRYDESPWRLALVELEDEELKEWRKSKDEEQPEEVRVCLLDLNPVAKKFSDAVISGVVRVHCGLVPE